MNRNQELALLLAVQAALNPDLVKSVVEASRAAKESGDTAADAGKDRTAKKGDLLKASRALADDVASRGWGGEHMNAAFNLALAQGGEEATIKAYRSTMVNLVEAVKEGKVERGFILSAPTYADIRTALQDSDVQELNGIRAEAAKAFRVFATVDLPKAREALTALLAITDPLKAAKEKAKEEAKAATGKPPQSQQPGASGTGEQSNPVSDEAEEGTQPTVASDAEAEPQRNAA